MIIKLCMVQENNAMIIIYFWPSIHIFAKYGVMFYA